MKPDISEFSYGFAVTQELATKHKLIEAPEFPTLIQEGKEGGYDVKLSFTTKILFLQFKLSDYLKYTSAKEHTLGIFEVPYYRMHLRPLKHSLQHKLLLELEKKGEEVYYIAPMFYEVDDFNHYYLKQTVVENSVFISPSSIGSLPDKDEHYVVFKRGRTTGYLCSDFPEEINIGSFEAMLTSLKRRENQPRDSVSVFRELANSMVNILTEVEKQHRQEKAYSEKSLFDIPGLRQVIEQREPQEACSFISRTIFNAELLLVSE